MMNFTTRCFIRKNTPKIRTNLIQLGYVVKEACDNAPFILCLNGVAYTSLNPNIPPIVEDCGTNEPLFLAIAALRDDSDYMQWFTDRKDYYLHITEDTNNPFNQSNMFLERMKLNGFHKATVSELIEHFKTEKP